MAAAVAFVGSVFIATGGLRIHNETIAKVDDTMTTATTFRVVVALAGVYMILLIINHPTVALLYREVVNCLIRRSTQSSPPSPES